MSMEVTSTYSGYATGTYDSSIKKILQQKVIILLIV